MREVVHHSDLRTAVAEILARAGLPPAHAHRCADALVAADLRGVESHGVSNMLRRYLDWLRTGHLNPTPEIRLLRDTACTATYDGDAGLGIVVLPELMEVAISKAGRYGVGMVAVRNARHSGMLAYHTMLAVEHNMIGVCATSGSPRVVPTFGREARLGTNPLSVAVPTGDNRPFVYDGATSTVAYNKLANARRAGEPFRPGWCAAPDGTPQTRPSPPDPVFDRLMLPLGATPDGGSHKGYGLAAVVEIFASLLSGGPFMGQLDGAYSGHFLAAIDPAAFGDPERFQRQVREFTAYLRATPAASGHQRVLVAGDPERETAHRRLRDGIPLDPEVLGWLDATCDAWGVDRIPRRTLPDSSEVGCDV